MTHLKNCLICKLLLCNTLILCMFALFSVGCSAAAATENSSYRFIGYESNTTISKKQMSDWISNGITILNGLNAKSTDYPVPQNDVRLYKVMYTTTNPDNNNSVERVSGLVALPVGIKKPLAILSYQHSSEFSRHFVPSNTEKSIEAQMIIATFAAQGYAVFIADYIGKGDSNVMHPYFLQRSESQASYDMILAGKKLCQKMGVELNGNLFLSGWSQGGQATMALHRLLEEKEESVTACAPIAGGYDLYLLWELWLTRQTSPFVPAIMANMLQAYENYSGITGLVNQAVLPQYQNVILGMFDNDNFSMADFQKFPAHTINFLQPEFIKQSFTGDNHFYKTLKANEVYMWRPKAKVRFYQGYADDIIPPETTEIAFNYMKKMGADVSLNNTGKNSDHRDSFLVALPDAYKWFASMNK